MVYVFDRWISDSLIDDWWFICLNIGLVVYYFDQWIGLVVYFFDQWVGLAVYLFNQWTRLVVYFLDQWMVCFFHLWIDEQFISLTD